MKKTKKTAKKQKKNKKLSVQEKKAYFAVGFTLFGICILLFTLSFFVLPKIQMHLEKRKTPKTQSTEQAKTVASTLQKTTEQSSNKLENTIDKKTPSSSAKNAKPKTKKTIAPTSHSNIKTPKKSKIKKKSPKKKLAQPKTIKKQKLQKTPIEKKGELVFVFDDAGHNLWHLEEFIKLPFKCTFAVLPGLPNSKKASDRIRDTRHELILHQPMQSINLQLDPGPQAITANMLPKEAEKILLKNLEEVAPVVGMNNHEGSLITANYDLMKTVLKVVKKQNLIFLDSRTSPKTLAPKIANELDLVILERDIFLDNSKSPDDIKTQIYEGMDIAEKKGYAILIGHVFTTNLAKILKQMYLELVESGFSFLTISEIADLKH